LRDEALGSGQPNRSQSYRKIISGTLPNSEAIDNLASYLRVDGLFNVNSTSVEAWKAVLGGLKGRTVVARTENGAETTAALDANIPVANLAAPKNIVTKDEADLQGDQWVGRRTLSDLEIEQLARAIVREVRKRGPFLSLADFINRRVGTDVAVNLAKSGAIQSALDSDDVAINRNQNAKRAVSSAVANRFAFPEAEEGPLNYGSPALVKQADILTPIAPVLSARSDSFLLRAYGEAVVGGVTVRAWCEAVVERDRNFIDLSQAAETPPASINPTNKTFGRRFNIISFRWLNSNEI
jgi:hypothetical protein